MDSFSSSLAEATLCELLIIQLTDGLIVVLVFWTKNEFYKPVHVVVCFTVYDWRGTFIKQFVDLI